MAAMRTDEGKPETRLERVMGELDRLTDGQAHIFRAADDDKSGTIDWPEFLEIG